MPRPFLVRAAFDDLPLKLVALVIAITLFVIVRTDKDAATGAYVKVLYTLPEDRVLVSDPIAEVRIGVRGPWTRLQRFDERELEPIKIDLTHFSDSELRFDEGMVKLPVGLRVASITPAEQRLVFEPRLRREVQVQPDLEGEPATGFHVARIKAQPPTVHVEGAASVVEAMRRVPTRPLRIVGARGPVRAELALEPAPRHTRFVDATTVAVEVDITPAMAEREFAAMPIRVLGLSRLSGQTDPPSARLILRGPAELVQSLSADDLSLKVDAQLVDTRPPSRYLRTVSVGGLPSGVAAEVQPDAVSLTTRRRHE